uniref:LysM domain-containing protein n=2 Tax=Cereibacter TaxID=1653176 RepID=A4WWE7_CERS5
MIQRIATVLWLCACPGGASMAQECPAAVPFAAADSLDDLAARCGVTADAILRANGASSEAELHDASAVAIPGRNDDTEGSLLVQAGEVLEDTAREAGAVAAEAGDAAADHLAGTEFGQSLRYAIDQPSAHGATMLVTRTSPGRFQIEVSGLRAGQEVTVTAFRRGELLAQDAAVADGALTAHLMLPGLDEEEQAAFVLEAREEDLRLTATSPDG